MSKQKLVTRSAGFLHTNAGRIGQSRTQPQIAPNNEPHADECGCLKCRVISMTDDAIERQLGELADERDGLAPTPGILGNSQSKRSVSGPLLLPRGVLAGGEA
jgi:hypothetical protein